MVRVAAFTTFFIQVSLIPIAFMPWTTGELAAQVIPSGYVPRLTQAPPRTMTAPNVVHQVAQATTPMAADIGPPAPPATQSIISYSTASSAPTYPVESTMAPVPNSYMNAPMASDPILSDSVGSFPAAGCDAPGCGNWACDGGPTCGAAAPSGCDSCGAACGGQCGSGGYHWIDTLGLYAGVHGFKNGVNRGESGSFGFQQGFNWGSPWVFAPLGMNTQLGFRGTQADFHGSSFTTEHRGQYFVTAGFFKRNLQGMQGGIVFDYLHDDWYTTIDLLQVRGEISYGAPTGNSFGFAFAQSITDDDTTSVINGQSIAESWETQDTYTLFWEMQSQQCRFGKFRILGGATGEADAIFGAQFKLPMVDNFSLESEFTYLVPNEGAAQGGTQNEAWNVAFQLVWYPARSLQRTNYRMSPMFDVAGNGSMISRRKP